MQQLTRFPEFQPITTNIKNAVEAITCQFPPYSDFNFASMFSWDTQETMAVSVLNENLLVQFTDYRTNEPFLSLLGASAIEDTIISLLQYCAQNGIKQELGLVPETVINHIKHKEDFSIQDDPDARDYIIDAKAFSELQGDTYASKRNSINRFKASNSDNVRINSIELTTDYVADILDTFERWRITSNRSAEETAKELRAIEKLAEATDYFNLEVLGIYIQDQMVAFSIYELLDNGYAIGHFEKALISYHGLFDFLKHQTASRLVGKGVRFINYEQDLGIEGLRKAKQLLHPVTYLKKYTICI